MTTESTTTTAGAHAPSRVLRLIAVPAAVTLAVSSLRLVGELRGWSPALFGTEAGGGGALVGIGWLIPVFGAWFGWRLARGGDVPPSRPRAILAPLVGLALVAVTFWVAAAVLPTSVWTFLLVVVALPAYAALAWYGWPQLARVDLWYAVSARVPVIAITVVAVGQGWGTHYEKLAPGSEPMSDPMRALVLCAAQVAIWIPLTMLVGGVAGGIAAVPSPRARAGSAR